MNVLYHPGKANVEVDALSRLSMGSVAHVKEERKKLAKYVHRLPRLGVCLTDTSNSGVIVQNGSESSLIAEGRLCVPNVGELRQQILTEAYSSRHHDSIWVIVDRVTKSSHFLAVKTTDSAEDYTKLYIHEIVKLHRVPLSIISDRGEAAFIGPDLVYEAIEKVHHIRDRLKVAQSHQKTYADVRRSDLGSEIDDWVFVKVSHIKGAMRFGKKVKLSPRYVGPYKILKRVGNVAYELEFPTELAAVYPVFHISLLKKCVGDPASLVPLESVVVKDSLTFKEVQVDILDRKVRKLRNKEVTSVKVLWRSQSVEEATWKAEAVIKAKYHHIFPSNYVSA
ncbi:hypothetical protein MTR67_035477 [Solanum verrucosum]|uniref:Tf2-1-like SH3-like domain-containing protein n=1 Tax=Solanum verrucosum TaxID=315347 RepID=A0AAF0ZKB8_SOLVR|nr:hypothetical protein MTR67_035477 [Solanum verrucosum]